MTLLLLGCCVPAWGAQSAPAFSLPAATCQVDAAPIQGPAPERGERPQPPRPTPEAGEASPPQAREIEALVGLLKALSDPKGSEGALAAMAKGQPFSLTRYALVLGDVRSVVTQMHSAELIVEMERAREMSPEAKKWVEHSAKVIDTCAKSRFVARGGDAAQEKVRAAVTKYRRQLEPLLFQEMAQVPGAQPAPRPPTSGKKGS